MSQLWRSFIPHHVAQDFHINPGLSPIGREQRFPAVVLFADVSGFTSISEALGQTGRRGAEKVTEILNSYFSRMIDLVHKHGGIVGKFGGDAMTVIFPYTAATRQAVTRRAIQCALEMQASMTRYEAIPTSVGAFSLAMKAGLAAGPLFCTTVGDPDIRLEYIIAGSALDKSAAAEHHADRGEVVVANSLLSAAGQTIMGERRGDFTCLDRLRRAAPPKPLPSLSPLPPESFSFVGRYIHPGIAKRLQREQTGFINEHRQVTVIFNRFSSFDYDNDPDVGAKLQKYLAQVIRIIHRYDGYLNKVDMGDKGSKYIILFGAPVGHEDDEERALRCALELRQIPGPTVQMGVNTGFVYCGLVGSTARREYTVMGDTVNMAARIMQAAASGQILTGRPTWSQVPHAFEVSSLPAMPFKGKSNEYEIFAVEAVRRQTAVFQSEYSLPLVGRTEELKQAQDLLRAVQRGQGQVLGITAPAGVGKSRFSSEIIQDAARQGVTIYGGAAESYGVTTQYLAWRDIWRGFFGVSDTALPAAQVRQLSDALTQLNPRLADRLPLLGPVLNLEIEENNLTRSLEPQMRVDLLKTLLLDCLRRQTEQRTLLLIIEDCHWLDDLSRELFAFIGHNLTDLPILLLALYRPTDDEDDPLSWVTAVDPVTVISLPDLTPAESKELARLKLQQLWQDTSITNASLLQKIAAKAQGNPFYLEEMVNYLHDRQIEPDDETALDQLEVPDSLHNLIISRIDQLSEAHKTTLKVASVIGRIFPQSWIWGSYPQAGSPAAVKRHLSHLRRLDLTPLYREQDAEPTYIFKHITTQEVAYESLAFSTRAVLHEQVGQFIEEKYETHLTQYIDVLAHHYGRSHNADKQRRYFRQAGEVAQKAYANQAAIDYYTRLLPLLPDDEQPPIQYALAQVRQHIGHWQKAETLYREALEGAEDIGETAVAAAAALALGGLLFLSDPEASEDALNWLHTARRQFEQIADRQGVGRVLERLSFIHSQQGDYEQALTCARQQLQIAQEYDDPVGMSGALDFMGTVYFLQGSFEQAETSLKEAVAIARQADYKRGIILASNDLAGVYWQHGDHQQSLSYLQQSQTISQEIGDKEGSEVSIGNAGLLYHHSGQEEEAVNCLLQALAIATELNDWATIATLLGNLGKVLRHTGQRELALHLTERAIALNRSLNMPRSLAEFLQQKAQLLADGSQYEQAVPFNEEALTIAQRIQHPEIQFEAELLAVRLRLARQEIDEDTAVAALNQLAVTWREDEEQAAILYEITQLTADPNNRQKAAELYQNLYQTTPKARYQRRYHALTGRTLPDAPPLPPPPQFVDSERLKLADLLQRAGITPSST